MYTHTVQTYIYTFGNNFVTYIHFMNYASLSQKGCILDSQTLLFQIRICIFEYKFVCPSIKKNFVYHLHYVFIYYCD